MIGKRQLNILAQRAIKEAKFLGATQVEVVLWNGNEELTRFANNEIHQSVSLSDLTVHVRVVIGKKIGVARGNSTLPEQLSEIVKQAVAIARIQTPDKHFKSLPSRPQVTKDFSELYQRSHHAGAVGRANAIAEIIASAKKAELVASGAYSESESELLIANSLGVQTFHASKSADLGLITTGRFGSGYAGSSTRGGREIDYSEVAKRAITKATVLGVALDIEPGEYEVILEPPAVAEIFDFFSWLGPNARIFHEEVSFFKGFLGKKLLDSKLTIHDDPSHPDGYPIGFDLEGYPKKKLTIISNGRVRSLAYDSYHAAKYGRKNTGHALLAPNTWGPIPTHLVIEPGDKDLSTMVNGVKRGLLVTRFWYTRVVSHKDLILTGMTRDGTFLIENGQIVARVKNLRYTESVTKALNDVRGVGSTLSLEGSEGSPVLVPHLHLGKFNFSSAAKHG